MSPHTLPRPLICGPEQWNSASHICCVDSRGPGAQVFYPEVIKREKRSCVCANPQTHQKALGRGRHGKATQVKLIGCNSSQSLILKFCESHSLPGTVCKLSGVWAWRRKTPSGGWGGELFFFFFFFFRRLIYDNFLETWFLLGCLWGSCVIAGSQDFCSMG